MYVDSRPLSCAYTEENCESITPSHLLLGCDLQGRLFSTAARDENIELNVMKCRKLYNHLLINYLLICGNYLREYLCEL